MWGSCWWHSKHSLCSTDMWHTSQQGRGCTALNPVRCGKICRLSSRSQELGHTLHLGKSQKSCHAKFSRVLLHNFTVSPAMTVLQCFCCILQPPLWRYCYIMFELHLQMLTKQIFRLVCTSWYNKFICPNASSTCTFHSVDYESQLCFHRQEAMQIAHMLGMQMSPMLEMISYMFTMHFLRLIWGTFCYQIAHDGRSIICDCCHYPPLTTWNSISICFTSNM